MRFLLVCVFSLSISAAQAATDFFTVNSTGDQGDANPGDGICQTDQTNCTLRAAIEESNAFTNSVSIISLNSPGPDPTVILVGADLPPCEKTVHLQRFGPAPLAIEGIGNAGLEFLADSNLIGMSVDQGFSINGFANGIVFSGGSYNQMTDMLIGWDAEGVNAAGNVGVGILIENSSGNTIGGFTDGFGDRHDNVISASGGDGVLITGTSSSNSLVNNLIGLDVEGLSAAPNQGNGVHINGGNANRLYGSSTNSFSVISGNTGHGVFIDGAGTYGNNITCSRIGLARDGLTKIANAGDGVQILDSGRNNIGSFVLISGNNGNGVTIDGATATNNSTGATIIGADIATNAAANGGRGILIRGSASANQVGNGGVIAFNNGPGVAIVTGTNNLIAFPSIFGNGGLAIDLGDDGQTANDALDADTGPNNFQNYPAITAVTIVPTGTVFQGTMDSKPNTSYTIYHVANGTDCGNGDARTFLFFAGRGVFTDGTGHGAYHFFVTNQVAEGTLISAYALDNSSYPYNVSEFSPCVAAGASSGPAADLSVNVLDDPDPVTVGSNITYTIAVHNSGPATATGVTLSNTLSSSVSFVSASAVLSHVGSLVTGSIGNIPSGASSNFFITVSTISTGTITNKATVHGNESDPGSGNNTANTPTTVANGTTFIQFCVKKYDVTEDGVLANITVCRSGDIAGTNQVDYSTADRTATNGLDYTAVSGTLTFLPLEEDKDFDVPIIQDNEVEQLEKVDLILSNPTGGAQLGALSNGVLRITDTTPITRFQFSSPLYFVEEADTTLNLTVFRVAANDQFLAQVHFGWADGSAFSTFHYQAPNETLLTFLSGSDSGSIPFSIYDNSQTNGNRVFFVDLRNPQAEQGLATLGDPPATMVVILDDEPAQPESSGTVTNNGNVVTATVKGGNIAVSTRTVTNGVVLHPRARAPRGPVQTEEVVDIVLSGTDPASSSLSLKAKAGANASPVKIGVIASTGGLKSISAKGIEVTGSITVNDYVASITIGDLADGATILTGGTNTQGTRITAHVIGDGCTIQTGSSIASLAAAKLGACEIIVPSVASVGLKGDKKVGILGDSLAKFTISGAGVPTGGLALGRFSAANAISNSEFNVNGNIGAVSALQIVNSTIKAGFTPTEPDTPLEAGTFVPGLSIASVSTKGAFIGSLIAADQVATVKLGSVNTNNAGTAFGVFGNSSVQSVSVTVPTFKLNPTGADDQSVGDFHVKK